MLLRHIDALAALAVQTARGIDPLLAQPHATGAEEEARRNLLLLATALQEQRMPTQEEIDVVAGVAVDRAREGVQQDAFARGYTTVLRAVWGRLAELADAEGVDGSALHSALQTLWGWADAMSAHATGLYSALELEQARQDEQARNQFLRRLVEGAVSAADVRTHAAAFGLQPGQHYVAVRATLEPGHDLAALERAVRTTMGGRRPLLGLLGDDLVGVLPAVPEIPEAMGTLAVGPGAELAEVSQSYNVASKVLAAALRFGRRGTVRLEDLEVRLAVAAEDDVGEHLERRYLAPLAASREDLAGTVDSYFRNAMHIDAVAKELFLHANTVRKRLHRFEELTGSSLSDTEAIIAIWWAIRRRELRRPPT